MILNTDLMCPEELDKITYFQPFLGIFSVVSALARPPRPICQPMSAFALPPLIGFKAICIPLVAEVFVFPTFQSPHDVALIFRTCQLHTSWEFQHENGGSECPAAWHGQMHWQVRKYPEKYQTRRIIDTGIL